MLRIALFLFILCGVFYFYVRYLERNALFFPEKHISVKPSDVGLDFEDVYIPTEDLQRLHGWYVPAPGHAATILYLHGNAGNISGRIDKIRLFHEIGLNVLIIDYRGYGNSTGYPTEEGINIDAEAAYHYLTEQRGVSPDQLIVMGGSLGGAPAIDLVSKFPAACLVIDSSFSNATDMASIFYPFIPTFLITIKLDNDQKIVKYDGKKLFIHSKDDNVVPYHLGKKLYDAAKEPKEFMDLKGAHMNGHIDDIENYRAGLEQFFRKHHFID